MTKWKNLTGKFTEEELKIIKQFQKDLNLNDNQFVRKSIEIMVFYFRSLIKLAESNVGNEMDEGYSKIMKEIAKYPELNVQVQPFLEKMLGSYTQTIEQIVKEDEPKIEKFTEKRQIGRPKSLKKNPGRPKDTGK